MFGSDPDMFFCRVLMQCICKEDGLVIESRRNLWRDLMFLFCERFFEGPADSVRVRLWRKSPAFADCLISRNQCRRDSQPPLFRQDDHGHGVLMPARLSIDDQLSTVVAIDMEKTAALHIVE